MEAWRDSRAPTGFAVSLFAGELDTHVGCTSCPTATCCAESRTEKSARKPPAMLDGPSARVCWANCESHHMLRDADRGPRGSSPDLDGESNMPFGMWLGGDNLYVANTDGVVVSLQGRRQQATVWAKKFPLTGGRHNNHWTRNIVGNAEVRRATVGRITTTSTKKHLMRKSRAGPPFSSECRRFGDAGFCDRLRNPNGMDGRQARRRCGLSSTNARLLGDDLVPNI